MTGAQRWAGTGAWVTTLLSAVTIDLLVGRETSLTVVLVFAPFVASALCSPRETTLAGLIAVACAVTLAWPGGTAGTPAHAIRAAAVAAGAGLALQLAVTREKRDGTLRAVTRVAEAAQQAILHPLPRRLRHVSLAGVYQSATAEARIGGDFFEAVDSAWGSRIILGDVRGKGLEAVRLAAAVLGEFRSRARTEPTLADVVENVESAAARLIGPEDFATAIFLEARPGELHVVRCGHPQPLVVAGGRTDELSTAGTLPLGLGADASMITSVALPAGTRILLYSDGAIEARDSAGVEFDLAGVFAELAGLPMEQALEELLARLALHGGGTIDDDVALLFAETAPVPPPAGEPCIESR